MFTLSSKGSFKHTEKFLKKMSKGDIYKTLDRFALRGVQALASYTPKDSGVTAESWGYEIEHTKKETRITWTNSHVVAGRPIVILLQYGHGTGTGGYVAGRDFINPALRPIFNKIAEDVWKAVTSA